MGFYCYIKRMAKWSPEKLNGPLGSSPEPRQVHFTPYPPAPDLDFYIERYWALEWDLRGQAPFCTDHLPDASVHLIVEAGLSGIFGPARGRFTRLVEGAGYAFCVKFRPGGFYPFLGSPVSGLAHLTRSFQEVFGEAGLALETAIRAAGEVAERIAIAEDFLRRCLRRSLRPVRDEQAVLVHQIVGRLIADGETTRSLDLERQFHLTRRTLQRLFNRWVGVSPSWVIRRYRIHDALDRLGRGEIVDWPALAAGLGYFDQAHFIKDFRKLIGVSPGQYARQVALQQDERQG